MGMSAQLHAPTALVILNVNILKSATLMKVASTHLKAIHINVQEKIMGMTI
jgi:hypothetical protein